MKKFSMDRPDYEMFDVLDYDSQLNARVRAVAPASVMVNRISDVPIARRPGPLRPYRNGIKRMLDIMLVLVSLPIWLPVVVICAAALWLESGQPFYRQERLGKDNSRFSIFKLRTMVRNADAVLQELIARDPDIRAEWDALQKLRNDPRITPVGKFLRATSMDELPQLINVLKGEMSLVGPRPMMPDQLSLYGDPSAYFAVRPGLTGLWQVSARNNNKFTYRHGIDKTYEDTLSFRSDLTILFKTVAVVLKRTGC